MDARLTSKGGSVGLAIRGTDNDMYSINKGDITYYAFAPMGTSINSPKWSLIKLLDDGTNMRKCYPLSPEKFSDYNPSTRHSDRWANFDPSDDTTYTIDELSFSAEYFFKSNAMDTLYYSDVMDIIIT